MKDYLGIIIPVCIFGFYVVTWLYNAPGDRTRRFRKNGIAITVEGCNRDRRDRYLAEGWKEY